MYRLTDMTDTCLKKKALLNNLW